MTDAPKTIGRYEVQSLLGEGGMGRVYLARDPVLARDVAIKVLREDRALPEDARKEMVARMRAEARAAATVRHPNLVTLHDMGEGELGLFLVFEYVPGPTLRERISAGPIPPLEVARIAIELGAALTTAHEAGVTHRDVKPENIICSPTGAVLADFGLARLDSSYSSESTGSVAYSAPETLVEGGSFSPASDQFSLAVSLYEALAGKRAFAGGDLGALAASIAKDEPQPLSEARPPSERSDPSERLMLTRSEGVMRRALQKEPTLRYPTCRAFGEALGSAIDVRISSGFPTISMHSASIVPRATRRWQNIVVAAALAVIVVLLLIGRSEQNKEKDKDNASLKSVASDFSATVQPRHRGPRIHVPPPSASVSSSAMPAMPAMSGP